MPALKLDPAQVVGETVATALGSAHREDPVLPRTGGPAGNASLTAWVGLIMLALLLVECATLVSMSSLIAVHIFVGAVLIPLALLKTATTGWRMLRYYAGAGHYLRGGPPPLLLRVLGPLVVVGALAVLGTGLALVPLGAASRDSLFSVVGQQVSPLTLHQAAFVVWLATTGLHVLGRLVPAVQIAARSAPSQQVVVPGARVRLVILLLSVAVAALAGVLTLHGAGDWTGHLMRERH